MTLLHLVVLAMVQGITEFLPISSSGHLVLVPALTGWPDQGLALDVAVHMGTLGAVILYFRRDVATMAIGALSLCRLRWNASAKLFTLVAAATIPVVIGGLAFKLLAGDALRSVEVIAWATIGFGILLYVADRVGHTGSRVEKMGMRHALIIGMWQILALIPGTSRSGITMTAGRFLGYDRTESARFSMLLSIPTILAAGVLLGVDVVKADDFHLGVDVALGAAFAFVSALAALIVMMRWLKHQTFTPFVIYRLGLGAALLTWVYL